MYKFTNSCPEYSVKFPWNGGSVQGFFFFLPEMKRLVVEVVHLPPSSTEFQNEWVCTPISPIHIYVVDRDNFAFCAVLWIDIPVQRLNSYLHTHTHAHTHAPTYRLVTVLHFGIISYVCCGLQQPVRNRELRCGNLLPSSLYPAACYCMYIYRQTDRRLVHLHPALISMSNTGLGRGAQLTPGPHYTNHWNGIIDTFQRWTGHICRFRPWRDQAWRFLK